MMSDEEVMASGMTNVDVGRAVFDKYLMCCHICALVLLGSY